MRGTLALNPLIIQSIIIQVQGLLDEENREELIEEICEEYQEIREDYQESLKVVFSPYKAVWRIPKLILIGYKKIIYPSKLILLQSFYCSG